MSIGDEVLGTLKLNRDYEILDGEILWNGEEVSLALEIDLDDEKTRDTARRLAHKIMADSESWDKSMREFAAKELTGLANAWQADDDEKKTDVPITEEEFAQRIALSELSLTYEGDFTAYFDDNDLFWGHTVEVCGSLENGIESANIAG